MTTKKKTRQPISRRFSVLLNRRQNRSLECNRCKKKIPFGFHYSLDRELGLVRCLPCAKIRYSEFLKTYKRFARELEKSNQEIDKYAKEQVIERLGGLDK